MFSSWEGFTKGAGVLWGKFTKEAQKQSRNLWLKFGGPIAPYWEFLKIVAGDAWKVFSDAVRPYWEGASTAAKAAWGSFSVAAKPYWDGVATATNKAWDTITAYAKTTFDKLKDTWVGEKAGQTGSAVGNGVSKIAKGVGAVYTKAKEAITGYSDKTMEQAKVNVSGDFPQYKTSGSNKKLNHALSFAGGSIKGMTEAETRAFAANVAQTESGFNKKVQNKHGYTGMYQFGAEALTDIGFIKSENYIAARQEAKKAGIPWDYTSKKEQPLK